MNDTLIYFLAGLSMGSLIFSYLYFYKSAKSSSSRIKSLESENQILHSKLEEFRDEIMTLQKIETDNAKLKYQAEAANSIAKSIVDAGLLREQELTIQLEEEWIARIRAEIILQEVIIKYSTAALEVESDILPRLESRVYKSRRKA